MQCLAMHKRCIIWVDSPRSCSREAGLCLSTDLFRSEASRASVNGRRLAGQRQRRCGSDHQGSGSQARLLTAATPEADSANSLREVISRRSVPGLIQSWRQGVADWQSRENEEDTYEFYRVLNAATESQPALGARKGGEPTARVELK
jgi:hypothetical protein